MQCRVYLLAGCGHDRGTIVFVIFCRSLVTGGAGALVPLYCGDAPPFGSGSTVSLPASHYGPHGASYVPGDDCFECLSRTGASSCPGLCGGRVCGVFVSSVSREATPSFSTQGQV